MSVQSMMAALNTRDYRWRDNPHWRLVFISAGDNSGRVTIQNAAKWLGTTENEALYVIEEMVEAGMLAKCARGLINVGINSPVMDDYDRPIVLPKEVNRQPIPSRIRNKIYARDGEVCAYCGDTHGPFAVDHIFPRSKGGDNSLNNLTISCRSCNTKKSANTLDQLNWSINYGGLSAPEIEAAT